MKIEKIKLGPDEILKIGRKIYGWCDGCDSLVRLNKPIFGDMHSCKLEDDD